jgi:hypothetical protein
MLIACITYVFADERAQEEYIIQKSDTLWGISTSKLQDPFLWPKLWNVNPHISNPDLIYPGEKIIIPSKEELMQQVSPPSEQKEHPVVQEPLTVREVVKKSKIQLAKPAPTIGKPLPEIKAYKKFLIDKTRYASIGWISEEFPSIGEIISTPSGRKIAGRDDIVYINISPEKMLSDLGLQDKPSLLVTQNDDSKSRFFAIRKIKAVNHPVTEKKLGYLIRVTGILEVIGIDDNTPKAKIIHSFEDIQVGDGLIPYKEMDPPLAPDIIRNPKVEGYVVESLFTHELSSEKDIIFLDKGQNDGLQAGDVFSVFSTSPVERVIGKIQVVSLKPATSAAIILTSDEEIVPGLKLGQK